MPCKTIAVANQKGGTGKTATTLSLGVALARLGKRVLLVDTDPQGDLTKSLGWKDPDSLETTLADHLAAVIAGEPLAPAEGILSHREGVDLMPANIELAGMEMAVFMAMSREQVLNMWASPLKGAYDYIIMDCAPTLGIIPVNAFVAADSVLIPVSAEYLPASGMTGLLKTVERVRRQINPALEVEGVLVTLFDSRNNLAKDVEGAVRSQYGSAYRVFDAVIPRAVSAAESPPPARASSPTTGRARWPAPSRRSPRRWSAVARKKLELALPTVDDLFTSQGEREQDAGEKVLEIALGDIESFPGPSFQGGRRRGHGPPGREHRGERGARPLDRASSQRWEVRTCERAQAQARRRDRRLAAVPCVVRRMGDDEATIAMVDSNLQRETILPSERAFAYSMRLEAMKRQGQRTDLTSVQVEQKSGGRWSRSILAEELGTSEAKVQRFIRLTFLVPQLLSLVDAGRMKMLPAVEVSYLTEAEQEHLLDAMEAQACTPSHAQAVKMKRYSKEGSLTPALIRSVMEEEKPNQVEQLRIPRKSIARFFRPSATQSEIEGRIVRALELLEQAERRRDGLGGA